MVMMMRAYLIDPVFLHLSAEAMREIVYAWIAGLAVAKDFVDDRTIGRE